MLELGQCDIEVPVSLNNANSSSLRWQPWAITVCTSFSINVAKVKIMPSFQHCAIFVLEAPHLVGEQIVSVIDIGVRICFRKDLLDQVHFCWVFTDVTLKSQKKIIEKIIISAPR